MRFRNSAQRRWRRPASDHPGLRRDLLATCVNSLRNRRAEAEQVRQIGQETLPLLSEVQQHLDDQSRVNRLIARIDGLRARMNQLNDCYEAITQLTQQTELHRFNNDRQIASAKVSGVERQRRQLARDIANVKGVVDAVGQFQELIDNAIAAVQQPPSVSAEAAEMAA